MSQIEEDAQLFRSIIANSAGNVLFGMWVGLINGRYYDLANIFAMRIGYRSSWHRYIIVRHMLDYLYDIDEEGFYRRDYEYSLNNAYDYVAYKYITDYVEHMNVAKLYAKLFFRAYMSGISNNDKLTAGLYKAFVVYVSSKMKHLNGDDDA